MVNCTATPTAGQTTEDFPLRQLPEGLPKNACVSWSVDDCPEEFLDLIEDASGYTFGDPVFISYVSDSLRFSHAPRTAIVSEDVKGGTLYVE